MTGTTMDAAAVARNRLRMNSPSLYAETPLAHRSTTHEAIFNDAMAINDKALHWTDTVLKRHV